ncbi:MAG: hypothetical protein ACKVJJ_06310 [Fidelibacterota bacterium]|jgi:hypothetical protein
MKKYLFIIFIALISFGISQELKKSRPTRYTAMGFFDHKTGLGIFGVSRTLYQTDKHEIFAGLGLMPVGALSMGWKYYMNEAPLQYYSVLSIQKISAMGGEMVAPYLSLGGEKKLTEKLYFNFGISAIARIYSDKKANVIAFPALNLSWRK